MTPLESVLGHVDLFAMLRPDELGRVAKRFTLVSVNAGEELIIGEKSGDERLVVVVSGRLGLRVRFGVLAATSDLEPGDHFGEIALLTKVPRTWIVRGEKDSTLALVDRAAFDALLDEFPVVSLPLADRLARELHTKTDACRQLLELHAEALPKEELAAAIADRRAAFQRGGARVERMSVRAIFRRLVVQEGAEPPFWMLVGFLAALGGARLVVHLILKYHLEKQLFALVPGSDPNPMHVHHFNYGLILIGIAGLAALFPFGRRALRALAAMFGVGAGLVFDEFALFWNLNPEYAQRASLVASAIVASMLLMLTYFRRFWLALARRAWFTLRGAR